jgi:peptidyl-prolyl cis-trans isomerase D
MCFRNHFAHEWLTMFEFVRTHRRLMQFALLLFIVPSFAFVGLDSYTRMSDKGNQVAEVAGTPVTRQELDAAQREQMDRFRQMFGDQFDAKMFDTPEARQEILDNLVAQRALAAAAARDHLVVSDQTLQQTILGIQGMIGADGKFDSERYRGMLAMQGMTPAMYEARLRQDMVLQQVNAAIQSTAFAPKTVANRLSDLNDQQRDVQELLFKASDFAAQVKVSDDMIKAFYDKNIRQYEVPEQATAEYVVFSNEAVGAQVSVSEADAQSYYDQNAKRYTTEEQRRASHILVAVKKDATAEVKTAAKAKAEGLLAQIRKNPAELARLAKDNSDDPGSAARGGDLDFFGKGMMVKPFEEASFKLKKGELSDLVESDFGFHIIMLTDVKPGAVKPFADVKGEITAEIRKQLAAKKYAEMVEVFTNTIYEQSDSLKPVADKLKLKIETADKLTRKVNATAAPGTPYNNVKLLAALFADDAVKNKRNTEAVEVAPNTMVAARIVDYKPATKRPLDEVRDAVRAQVMQEEALKFAIKAGEGKLAAVAAKDDATGFGDAKPVTRMKSPIAEATAAVMKADTRKLPAYVGFTFPGRGYGVYRITKVSLPETVDAERRKTEQQQITNAIAQQEMVAYIDVLKLKAKVKMNPSALAAPVAADGGSGDK